MKEFEELGFSPEMLKVIEKEKFKEPSNIQKEVVPLALKGHDIIGGSATGSGKTLAFATPIIENLIPNEYVQALILTPTRELAIQVSSSIKKFAKYKDLECSAIYGGVGIEPQIKKIANSDIIVGTPGRILDHLERKTLRLDFVKFLVLDEVDRMFDMGFYKDVERIINHCPKERQTLLFSATISAEVNHLAQLYTKNPKIISVESYVDHTKLKQVYYDLDKNKKFSLLVHLLKEEDSKLVMIFCNTRRNVDFLEKNLRRTKINAHAIHGGLSQNQRTKVLKEFNGAGVQVLICTDVAARGLDIPAVTHVYNYDLPNNPDDYVHRIGRTARAGKNGKAISLLASRDYDNFERIIRNNELKITPLELPKFENLRFNINTINKKGNFRRNKPYHGKYTRRTNSHSSPRRNTAGNRTKTRTH